MEGPLRLVQLTARLLYRVLLLLTHRTHLASWPERGRYRTDARCQLWTSIRQYQDGQHLCSAASRSRHATQNRSRHAAHNTGWLRDAASAREFRDVVAVLDRHGVS